MKRKALRTILEWVNGEIANAPIKDQIKIYDALGQVLPDREARRRATEIAVTLSEVAKLQLDFNSKLFGTLLDQTRDGHGNH